MINKSLKYLSVVVIELSPVGSLNDLIDVLGNSKGHSGVIIHVTLRTCKTKELKIILDCIN